jgi:hypothetical protein
MSASSSGTHEDVNELDEFGDDPVQEVENSFIAERNRQVFLDKALRALEEADALLVNSRESCPTHIPRASWKPILKYIVDKLSKFIGNMAGKRTCVRRDVEHWCIMLEKELGDLDNLGYNMYGIVEHVYQHLG